MTSKDKTVTLIQYPELNARLEEVLGKLQDPNIDVDAAVKYYEEAAKLIVDIERCLEEAQNQIKEITTKFIKDN